MLRVIGQDRPWAAVMLWVLTVVAIAMTSQAQAEKQPEGKPGAKAALSVEVVQPESSQWPVSVTANGPIAAWQEAIVGAEVAGLRLSQVLVNVGDHVKRGQLLATFQAESVQADVQAARAAVQEAEAVQAEAHANGDRARALRGSGALSEQEFQRTITAEQTAKARVQSAKAQLAAQELRLRQTRVNAPDDGIISARTATVGAVAQPGQELFKLIRQGRLEWHAELPATELARIRPGMVAQAQLQAAAPVQGKVRVVAPTIEAATRNGVVYIDLPAAAMASGLRAGTFASGRIEIGRSQGLTLPQSAVLLREGFSYVFKVEPNGHVRQLKVQTGRRIGARVEITQGLDAQAQVVASGVSFLSDGDTVRVVNKGPRS